jgi:hypothetical protein
MKEEKAGEKTKLGGDLQTLRRKSSSLRLRETVGNPEFD